MSVFFLDLPDQRFEDKDHRYLHFKKDLLETIYFWYNAYRICVFSVEDPRFPVSGGPNPPGAATLRFCQTFQKNCMKLKPFWAVWGEGGGAPWVLPLNPPLVLHNLSAVGFHCFHHHGLPRLKQRKCSIFFSKGTRKNDVLSETNLDSWLLSVCL